MDRTSLRKSLVRTYLTFDARSLGVFRIGLALLALIDLARRFPHVRDFYTNVGLLPNHGAVAPADPAPLPRSFLPASLGHEVWLLFAIGAFCYLCLLVGWRTRLFQLFSFLFAISLHNRDVFTENWGSVAMGALMAWSLFLPTGRRFSIDALLASLRARPDEQPDDLASERLPAPDQRPFVSLACLGALVQLAVIYWFNYLHKSGETWTGGTAIHYVLWQERIITTFGLWAREHAPTGLWKALTHGTRIVESSAPFLILAPVLQGLDARRGDPRPLGFPLGHPAAHQRGHVLVGDDGVLPRCCSRRGTGGSSAGACPCAAAGAPSTSTRAAACASRSCACSRAWTCTAG